MSQSEIKSNILTTTLESAINWGRKNSFWPMPFGTACCGIEFMAVLAARTDLSRFGAEAIRFSPRQSDLLIVAGRISIKMMPYESGVDPVGETRIRFSIRFFLIALLFIIFDIEIVFLYPWAVVFKDFLTMGSFIFFEMVVFLFILLFGFVYVWKNGALEWE